MMHGTPLATPLFDPPASTSSSLDWSANHVAAQRVDGCTAMALSMATYGGVEMRDFAKTIVVSVVGLFFSALVISLAAQAPVDPTFEAASVKRNRETQLTMSFITPLAGRVSAKAVTLKQLIE